VAQITFGVKLEMVADARGQSTPQWLPLPQTIEKHLYRRGHVDYDVPREAREGRRDYERTRLMLGIWLVIELTTVACADAVALTSRVLSSIGAAFPIREDGQPNLDRKNHVFAFLPVPDADQTPPSLAPSNTTIRVLTTAPAGTRSWCWQVRSFGFKFVVQADFLLVANREDIIKENVWNEFLRDKLPTVFVQLFSSLFKEDPRQVTSHHITSHHITSHHTTSPPHILWDPTLSTLPIPPYCHMAAA
jgi:hypothetical protein